MSALVCVFSIVSVACDQQDQHALEVPQSNGASTAQGHAAVQELLRIDLEELRALIAACQQDRQVLVLDFWATWCRPCVEMFPQLHAGLKELGPRVRVVSVTLDVPGESEAKAVAFLQRHRAVKGAYLLVPESDERLEVVSQLGQRWQDLVVPAILVYDQKGQLAGEFLGARADADTIVAEVKRLIVDD